MRFLIRYLIKIPILKRLIPSFFKKYIFFFKKYKKEILVNKINKTDYFFSNFDTNKINV